jgi:hypothetical protein
MLSDISGGLLPVGHQLGHWLAAGRLTVLPARTDVIILNTLSNHMCPRGNPMKY